MNDDDVTMIIGKVICIQVDLDDDVLCVLLLILCSSLSLFLDDNITVSPCLYCIARCFERERSLTEKLEIDDERLSM